jgi:hypothetical protein
MTTRTYYLPRNRIALHVINYMVSHIGCSIGDITVNRTSNTLKVPVTCNDNDVKRIERILIRYEMLEE